MNMVASFEEEGEKAEEAEWGEQAVAEASNDGNQRLEIHMEEYPDGYSKLSVIMEGATQLAASTATVAAMVLYAY